MDSKAFASGFAVLNMAYSVGMMIGPYVGSAMVTWLGLIPSLLAMGLGYLSYLLATRTVTS